MRRFLLPILCLCLISTAVSAQDFEFGTVDNNALSMQKYDKDTSAHAVVLNEYGKARIAVTNNDDVHLLFDHHITIKFFDDKEFERHGTFEIPIFSGDGQTYETLTEIKAITFYKDDNGNVQQAELDNKKIYRVVEDKHNTTIKFAMPALRKGCVIDIKYQIESPYYWNHFHTWLFQDDIPKVYSKFEAFIPGFWTYNATLRGYLKLSENKADAEQGCFSYHGASAGCSHLMFAMRDVPAFAEEEHMVSAKDYLSGVYFQLVEFQNLNTGAKEKYSTDWRDIDRQLKEDYQVSGQMKRKDIFKERVSAALAGKTDSLEKAKTVYALVQKSFKWNNSYSYWSQDGIKKAIEAHTGAAGDINLSLIAALAAAGVPAQAVLLSTRDHGSINKLYPTITDFNYVIARVSIGGNVYLLDATDAMLPFGMLPLRCLNDKGRVFSLDKPSYWIDMNTPQREKTTYTFDLTMQEDGKMKGTIIRYSTGYSAYLKRAEIKKFNSIDEYLEKIEESSHSFKIVKSSVANVDSVDAAIAETFDVEFKAVDKMINGRIGFNPFVLDQVTTNPFKLAQRMFPVDLGMPSEERYIVTVHLPAQYIIETPPQTTSFGLPNKGGNFLTDFQSEGSVFTFSYITRINNPVYSPEEYPYLKELYNKIILAEKADLVFKKKS